MTILFKIIAVGIITVLISGVLKKHNPEYALGISVAASAICFIFLSDFFYMIFDNIESILNKTGINSVYTKTVLKITVVAFLSEYTASFFYDAGESTMAKKVELAGKIIILIITMPVINSLTDIIISSFC